MLKRTTELFIFLYLNMVRKVKSTVKFKGQNYYENTVVKV